MNIRTVAPVVACILAGASTALCADAETEARLKRELKDLLVVRATTAKNAYAATLIAYNVSTVVTAAVVDASKALADAEVAAAANPEEEISALRRGRERMIDLETRVNRLLATGIDHGLSKHDGLTVKRERESAEIKLLEARIKHAHATP